MEEVDNDVNCNCSETSELQNCESWNLNNNNSSISENTDSRMSDDLILSANDSDLGILQRAPEVSSGTMNTSVDRGPMRPGVTDPMSLVKTMRSMAASIKELQDKIQKLEREITTLKRRRCGSACSNSTAKQPRLSFREPAANVTADLDNEEEDNTADFGMEEPVEEFDTSQEGYYEYQLAPRGMATMNLPSKFNNPGFLQ